MLRTCRGESVDRPPVWLMRQAGRYLPQYRAVREGVSFLEMCRDVERAIKVSLQPIDLVGAEAVILAGTDLNLAFDGRDPGYPVYDALDVHVALLADLATGRASL